MTRRLSSRSSAGRRSEGKRTCSVVKSGRWEGSRCLSGLEAGVSARPLRNASVLAIVNLESGRSGGGISEMAWRREVRSCRGVGREDDGDGDDDEDEDDIVACWCVLGPRPFERRMVCVE